MRRMILWTLLSGGVGFIGFAVLFYAAAGHAGPERGIFFVFALMAAIPVAIVGAILAALMALRDGLSEIRHELERLRRGRQGEPSSPTEQYQPKRFDRGPE